MTEEEILVDVRKIMVEMFELEASLIVPEATLRDQLGLDSIDAIDMAVRLQQMTGRRVELSSLRSIKTIADVVELVRRHLEDGKVTAEPSAEEEEATFSEQGEAAPPVAE